MEDKITQNPQDPSAEKTGLSEMESAQVVAALQKKVEELTKRNQDLEKTKVAFYDKVLNSNPSSEGKKEEVHRPIKEIRDELLKKSEEGVTNLDYCKLAVELDDESIRTKGKSVFLPEGRQVNPTAEEIATASKVNQVFKDCIEEANGDPVRFNMALQSRLRK